MKIEDATNGDVVLFVKNADIAIVDVVVPCTTGGVLVHPINKPYAIPARADDEVIRFDTYAQAKVVQSWFLPEELQVLVGDEPDEVAAKDDRGLDDDRERGF